MLQVEEAIEHWVAGDPEGERYFAVFGETLYSLSPLAKQDCRAMLPRMTNKQHLRVMLARIYEMEETVWKLAEQTRGPDSRIARSRMRNLARALNGLEFSFLEAMGNPPSLEEVQERQERGYDAHYGHTPSLEQVREGAQWRGDEPQETEEDSR